MCVWANNKFYGEKITIAFRVADGGLPASCITGGITDCAMAIPWRQNHPKKVKITQRRWSRGWLFHGTNHPRMALPWKNHPKKVEQRIAKAVVARIPEMA